MAYADSERKSEILVSINSTNMPPEQFFESLRAYYANAVAVLRRQADASTIFPNPVDIGTSREQIYAAMLKLHLPSNCNVFLGGFLFDLDGAQSNQIDILITDGYSLQYRLATTGELPKSFACIDGCVAVISVKSMLDSANLEGALLNIASIPEKQPLTGGTYGRLPSQMQILGFDDWPYKIIYASDGMRQETTMESLARFYEQHSDIPFKKRPNLIHGMRGYTVIRAPEEGLTTRREGAIAPNTFTWSNDVDGAYGLMWAISQVQSIVSASKIINTAYGRLINRIPF